MSAQQAATSVVVVGAGPAGLAAAHELVRRGIPTAVLEKGARVGGLARTEQYRGFRFDIGGHRFFTKVPEVAAFWLRQEDVTHTAPADDRGGADRVERLD